MSGVPNVFGSATSSIPLSQLDVNFNTPLYIGNTSVGLGNTVTSFGNVTLTNTTISSATSVTSSVFYPSATSGVGIQMTSTGNNNGNFTIANNYGQMTLGVEGTAGQLVTGSSQGAALFGNSSNVAAQLFTNNTVRATIDNSGNLLVGTTSFNYANNGVGIRSNAYSYFTATSSTPLLINQNGTAGNLISFNYAGSSVGSISTNGVSTTYNTTSDRRLKSNIVDLTTIDSGTLIDSLLPRKFTWTSSGQADVGFIADEVQSVLPSAVSGDANATKEEEYEVTPAVKDEQGNITTPSVMGTRTVPNYQMVDMSIPEMMAYLVAEVKSLRARLKAANIA